MYRIVVMGLIIAFGVSLSAQTIALTGKVTNQSGKAISGAIVTIKSKQLSATTDAAGVYSISSNTGVDINRVLQSADAISLNNGSIILSLAKPVGVRIELFDMKGNLLKRVLDNPVSAGEYRYDLRKNVFTSNVIIVRVSTRQHTSTFRYLPLNIGKCVIHSSFVSFTEGILAKLQATVDSLQASASSCKTRIVAISSYEGTVDITLDTIEMGTCTPSKSAGVNVSGSGPHKVTVEINSDKGIKEGTIYRPSDLGAGKNYPIFVWGEGGCSLDGKSNSAAVGEIASYGYFVIADGTPGNSNSRSMNTSDPASMGVPLLAYITWAIAENRKPCSAYYQSLDTTKIATNGFSCGGLMAEGTAGDKRITTWGLNSSGLFSANQAFYKTVHTPVLIVLGGSDDIAYQNGERDYDNISALGIPIMLFSKNLGHGGDLFSRNGGDFTKIDLAWLNWWLKDDVGATGKGVLVGSSCKYCTDNAWEVKSKNLP